MKKLFLLFASSSIALFAGAQQKASMFTVSDAEQEAGVSRAKPFHGIPLKTTETTANKGTAPNRWYGYYDLMDTVLREDTKATQWSSTPLWNDTLAQIVYSSGTSNNRMVSIGSILDPSAPGFNKADYYPGVMKVDHNNAYKALKVRIYGVYAFNPAKTMVKDTIRLSFVEGNAGARASDDIFSGVGINSTHYGTKYFLDAHYDSANNYMNVAGGIGSPAPKTYDIILDNSGTSPAWADTLENGMMVKEVTIPGGGLNVSADGYVAMSIAFKSGDNTFPTAAPGAVVWNIGTSTFNYNMFMPAVSFRVSDETSSTPEWMDFTNWNGPDSNANIGLYKTLPAYLYGWAATYYPMWGYATTSGAAYYLQVPMVDWEIECATCGLTGGTTSVTNVTNINTASAYPNPAEGELNIPFTLSNSNDVTVTLTNMLGQVVATQNFKNTATGKAVFNTTAMADGIYTYSVTAGGQRTTGRVSIAH